MRSVAYRLFHEITEREDVVVAREQALLDREVKIRNDYETCSRQNFALQSAAARLQFQIDHPTPPRGCLN